KLLEDQRASGINSLGYLHIDSWETGSQNWTPGFREEFRARRGYDLLPYLPLITGRAVEGQETSERFLWDLRRTVGDLLLENYAGEFRRLSHQHGLKLSIEAYGNGPLDDLPYAAHADLPLTEFWLGMEPWWVTREMASAAHTYGRPVLAAEAFTSRSAAGKWQSHPFRLKPLGDQMFTQGINRFVFHRYAMQPWEHIRPGIMMGPYGIHFERTNTWWEQSRAWLDYLSRCQFLLQQGRFVADIGYLASERIPNDYHEPLLTNFAVPAGYDYDMISAELLSKVTVRDGRAELPRRNPPAGGGVMGQLRRPQHHGTSPRKGAGGVGQTAPRPAHRHRRGARFRQPHRRSWQADPLHTPHRGGQGSLLSRQCRGPGHYVPLLFPCFRNAARTVVARHRPHPARGRL
ncbi:MAG: glycosyl hydrolase, partial [Acidobacteria bacterium]|nr:glycosyl hydrolase [Acidobacteriota bacterium]